MLVERKIIRRYVTVHGQHYRIPDSAFDKHGWENLAGTMVYVEDDPERWIQTNRPTVYWPGRHDFLCYGDVDQKSPKVD